MEPLNISRPPQPNTLQRALRWLLYIVIAVAVAIGMLLLFWSLQNPTVLDASNQPFPVRPDSNIPGQVEYMKVNYCKTFGAKGDVVARMVGKKSIIRIPWPVENSAPQCLNTDIPIVVPTYATDDTYYFDFSVTYQVNPIKKKIVAFRSQEFNIRAQK